MPLFATSKFVFKKSSKRSSSRGLIDNKLCQNIDNSDFVNSEDDDDNEDEKINQDKQKLDDKIIYKWDTNKKKSNGIKQANNDDSNLSLNRVRRKKQESIIKNDTSLERKKSKPSSYQQQIKKVEHQRNLILFIDHSQQFRFDRKYGIWNDLNNSSNEEKVHTLNSSKILTQETTKILDKSQSSDDSNHHQITELIDSIKTLKEENRLLKLKIEILIEMVTETTAELNLKDKSNQKVTVNKKPEKT